MYARGWIRTGLVLRVLFGSSGCPGAVSMSVDVFHVKQSWRQSGDSNPDVTTARRGPFSRSRMPPSTSWRDLGTSSKLLSPGLAHAPSMSTSHVEPQRVAAWLGSFVACLWLSACSPDCGRRVQGDVSCAFQRRLFPVHFPVALGPS